MVYFISPDIFDQIQNLFTNLFNLITILILDTNSECVILATHYLRESDSVVKFNLFCQFISSHYKSSTIKHYAASTLPPDFHARENQARDFQARENRAPENQARDFHARENQAWKMGVVRLVS